MTLQRSSVARVELLEQRRLLSADPEPGVYRNAAGDTITVEHSVGPFFHVTTDITIFDNGTIRRRDVVTFVEVFSGKNRGSVTDYVIDIPGAQGNGKVTIRVPNSGGAKSAAMDGELNPKIFLPDRASQSHGPTCQPPCCSESVDRNRQSQETWRCLNSSSGGSRDANSTRIGPGQANPFAVLV